MANYFFKLLILKALIEIFSAIEQSAGGTATSTIQFSVFSSQVLPPESPDKFDPCKLGTDNCSSHANCIRYGEMVNGVYKYNCTCIEGYKGSGIGENGCVAPCSNECDQVCNTTTNTCSCFSGYALLDNKSNKCVDINECILPNTCASLATCRNTNGGYTCSCPVGFIGNPNTLCLDQSKQEPPDLKRLSSTLTFNNPVINKTGITAEQTLELKNSSSSFYKEFVKDLEDMLLKSYQSFEKTVLTVKIISLSSTISNKILSKANVQYIVSFASSYNIEADELLSNLNSSFASSNFSAENAGVKVDIVPQGTAAVEDIDECLLKIDQCSDKATCTNTLYSYTCACLKNYVGNGFQCVYSPSSRGTYVVPLVVGLVVFAVIASFLVFILVARRASL